MNKYTFRKPVGMYEWMEYVFLYTMPGQVVALLFGMFVWWLIAALTMCL